MKKLISFLLSLCMMACVFSACADTPFPQLITELAQEAAASPDGVEIIGYNGEKTAFKMNLIKENGEMRGFLFETGTVTGYFGETGVTLSAEGTNLTIPYDLLGSGLSNGIDTEALILLFVEVVPELLQKLTGQGAITVEGQSDGSTVTVFGRRLMACLDTTVADLIEEHSAEIDRILSGCTYDFLPKNADALSERWNSLRVFSIDPGFDVLKATLNVSGEYGNTMNIDVTVDNNPMFDATVTIENGFGLTAHAGGHEMKGNLTGTSDGSLWYVELILDGKNLVALSFSAQDFNMSLADNAYSVSGTFGSDPYSICMKDNKEGTSIDLSVGLEPFVITEQVSSRNGESRESILRQTDSQGTCECMLEARSVLKKADGTEEDLNSFFLLIDRNDSGYTVRGVNGSEEITLLEISLVPEKVTPPDPGLTLTKEMIPQLLNTFLQ